MYGQWGMGPPLREHEVVPTLREVVGLARRIFAHGQDLGPCQFYWGPLGPSGGRAPLMGESPGVQKMETPHGAWELATVFRSVVNNEQATTRKKLNDIR